MVSFPLCDADYYFFKLKSNCSVVFPCVIYTIYCGDHGHGLWGSCRKGFWGGTSGRGAPRVNVVCQVCRVFSVCLCVQIKTTPGVVRCMGHGSCVNLNPGLLSHSFRTVRHNMQ